jgi:DNA-binding transcriptional LysR family regulator
VRGRILGIETDRLRVVGDGARVVAFGAVGIATSEAGQRIGTDMVRDAVRAGVGAARLPLPLVSHDLAAGTLVHWGDVDGPDITLWTLYPSRRLLSVRVSAFLEYLKEAFPMGTSQELAACLEG